MSDPTATAPLALRAADVPPRLKRSNYPEPFFTRMAGRHKRVLGDLFGLRTFGVNLTTLTPGSQSSLHHRHSRQDEFVYILDGEPTLVTDEGEIALAPGTCAGFAAGGAAHHLVNRTDRDVVYLEIGDRAEGDAVDYPVDDLQAVRVPGGRWAFAHKDGRPYED